MCLLIFLCGGILYMRKGEPTDNKKKDRKNTMTKEIYTQILHTTKSPEKLDGIVSVAIYDNEINLEDFDEILAEKNEIIMEL